MKKRNLCERELNKMAPKRGAAPVGGPLADQVWAEEGGVMVRFDRPEVGGQVVVTILEVSGRDEKVLAIATLGGWRWDRVVRRLGIPVDI